MIFLAPWALAAAAAAAALVVALHFLARERPPGAVLPTARFVPDRSARATVRAPRPRDRLLLALRVLAVLLAGAAAARPVVRPARRAAARVVALDVSGSVGDATAARDSARALLRSGDALVVFGRGARVMPGAARDSLPALPPGGEAGSLSAGLVAATRAASVLRAGADSVELVIISAFAREEWDAATARVRRAWPGPARLVAVAAARRAAGGAVQVAGPADDPLRATLALLGVRRDDEAPVRVVRGGVTSADSLWAREAGHVLVDWPLDPGAAYGARARPDTVGALLAGGVVMVAELPRTADLPHSPAARPVAWWVDGAPAAAEQASGDGCIRRVAVAIPARGDAALSEGARRIAAALIAPCGGARSLAPLADSELAVLRGTVGDVAPRAAAPLAHSHAAAWLLAACLALLLVEPMVRRRKGAS